MKPLFRRNMNSPVFTDHDADRSSGKIGLNTIYAYFNHRIIMVFLSLKGNTPQQYQPPDKVLVMEDW